MTWGSKTSFIAGNFPNHTQEVAVNRTELIESVAQSTGLDKKQAESAVSSFVESVIAETKAGNKVSIFGFGIFTPKSRAARTGRNPQTGAPVKIAASKSVGFQPAAAYKTTLNTRGGAKKAAAKKVAPAAKATPAKKVAASKKAVVSAKKVPAKAASKTAKRR